MPPGPEGGAIGTSKNILELAIASKYLKAPQSIWEEIRAQGDHLAAGGRTNPIRGCKPETHLSHTSQR